MPLDDRFLRTSQSIFVATTEEEYVQTFREAGWSEHAIEIELDSFRKFKERFPGTAKPAPEPVAEEGDPIASALNFRRKGRPQHDQN